MVPGWEDGDLWGSSSGGVDGAGGRMGIFGGAAGLRKFLSFCVWWEVPMCCGICVEARGQSTAVASLLLPRRSSG